MSKIPEKYKIHKCEGFEKNEDYDEIKICLNNDGTKTAYLHWTEYALREIIYCPFCGKKVGGKDEEDTLTQYLNWIIMISTVIVLFLCLSSELIPTLSYILMFLGLLISTFIFVYLLPLLAYRTLKEKYSTLQSFMLSTLAAIFLTSIVSFAWIYQFFL